MVAITEGLRDTKVRTGYGRMDYCREEGLMAALASLTRSALSSRSVFHSSGRRVSHGAKVVPAPMPTVQATATLTLRGLSVKRVRPSAAVKGGRGPSIRVSGLVSKVRLLASGFSRRISATPFL